MTDGVNVTHAHKFVGEFIPWNLVVHYGSLYLVGGRDGAIAGSGSVGLVWRYSGTTLTLLYEEGTGRDGEDHTIYGCTSFMRWLVWSRNGTTSTGRLPGLTYYDAELDSIHTGPTMPMDPASPGVTVWTVKNYSNTIVASFWDQHTYSATVVGPVALAQVRELGEVKHGNFGGYEGASFEYVSGGQERANALNSSEYDAGLPGERKVWLTGRLRAKIPALTRVYVNMTFDGTEYTVAEIAGGDGTWQTYTFDVLVDGVNPRSYVAKYTLQFNNTHNSINTLSTPEVDSFEVTYMVSPAPRRRWNLRVLASDGQMRLDGNENPLVTGEELVEQLESYWSDGVPLHYWDRSASGDTPADADSIKVMITNWSAQEYRLTTEDGSSMREVAMELLEIA